MTSCCATVRTRLITSSSCSAASAASMSQVRIALSRFTVGYLFRSSENKEGDSIGCFLRPSGATGRLSLLDSLAVAFVELAGIAWFGKGTDVFGQALGNRSGVFELRVHLGTKQ